MKSIAIYMLHVSTIYIMILFVHKNIMIFINKWKSCGIYFTWNENDDNIRVIV